MRINISYPHVGIQNGKTNIKTTDQRKVSADLVDEFYHLHIGLIDKKKQYYNMKNRYYLLIFF